MAIEGYGRAIAGSSLSRRSANVCRSSLVSCCVAAPSWRSHGSFALVARAPLAVKAMMTDRLSALLRFLVSKPFRVICRIASDAVGRLTDNACERSVGLAEWSGCCDKKWSICCFSDPSSPARPLRRHGRLWVSNAIFESPATMRVGIEAMFVSGPGGAQPSITPSMSGEGGRASSGLIGNRSHR